MACRWVPSARGPGCAEARPGAGRRCDGQAAVRRGGRRPATGWAPSTCDAIGVVVLRRHPGTSAATGSPASSGRTGSTSEGAWSPSRQTRQPCRVTSSTWSRRRGSMRTPGTSTTVAHTRPRSSTRAATAVPVGVGRTSGGAPAPGRRHRRPGPPSLRRPPHERPGPSPVSCAPSASNTARAYAPAPRTTTWQGADGPTSTRSGRPSGRRRAPGAAGAGAGTRSAARRRRRVVVRRQLAGRGCRHPGRNARCHDRIRRQGDDDLGRRSTSGSPIRQRVEHRARRRCREQDRPGRTGEVGEDPDEHEHHGRPDQAPAGDERRHAESQAAPRVRTRTRGAACGHFLPDAWLWRNTRQVVATARGRTAPRCRPARRARPGSDARARSAGCSRRCGG